MKKEKVLILYTNSLFAKGLVGLLSKERDLKVEGLLMDKMECGRRQIKSMRPDVVIIEDQNPVFDTCNALSELLKDNSKAFVIRVNLNQKDAVAYTGLRLAATKSNLLKLVRRGVGFGSSRSTGKEDKGENQRQRKSL
ncbi:MAG: hypothetical protein ACE5HC_16335 [Candidatus Binatia bacterium]